MGYGMKLTLEQRRWIEQKLWPVAEDAARAFMASISGEGVAINSADFAPISVALAVDRSDNECKTEW